MSDHAAVDVYARDRKRRAKLATPGSGRVDADEGDRGEGHDASHELLTHVHQRRSK